MRLVTKRVSYVRAHSTSIQSGLQERNRLEARSHTRTKMNVQHT